MASPQLHGRHSPEWTSEMRDRQARGKDPNKEEEEPPRIEVDESEVLKIGGRQVLLPLSQFLLPPIS